jgi:hypothetical protein
VPVITDGTSAMVDGNVGLFGLWKEDAAFSDFYLGYPESKFRWAIEKKLEFITI